MWPRACGARQPRRTIGRAHCSHRSPLSHAWSAESALPTFFDYVLAGRRREARAALWRPTLVPCDSELAYRSRSSIKLSLPPPLTTFLWRSCRRSEQLQQSSAPCLGWRKGEEEEERRYLRPKTRCACKLTGEGFHVDLAEKTYWP